MSISLGLICVRAMHLSVHWNYLLASIIHFMVDTKFLFIFRSADVPLPASVDQARYQLLQETTSQHSGTDLPAHDAAGRSEYR